MRARPSTALLTEDYPYPSSQRLLRRQPLCQDEGRTASRPRPETPAARGVIANLLAAQGSDYVWGGDVRSGVPEMLRTVSAASAPGTLKRQDDGRCGE